MQSTYEQAITQVFKDEGGYTDDPRDPGGPTNWGITLEDAKTYWKSDANANDVRDMPKSIAEGIYVQHYAKPLSYNDLPAGVDYSVLDYGINSGIHRSAKVLQQILGVKADGSIGPITIAAARNTNTGRLIDDIYQERLNFLRSLSTWSHFGHGWTSRCITGRALAHQLDLTNASSAKGVPPTTPTAVPSFWTALFNLFRRK